MNLVDFEEQIVHRFFSGYYRELSNSRLLPIYRRIAAEVTEVCSKGKIVDIGCGPGNLIGEIAALARGRGLVIDISGLDPSSQLASEGNRELSRRFSKPTPEIIVGDVHNIPLDDESCDCIVSTGSIHHWQDPAGGLAEIHRVLKPKKKALIYDQRRPGGPIDIIAALRQGFIGFGFTALSDAALQELAEESPFKSSEVDLDGMLIRVSLQK